MYNLTPGKLKFLLNLYPPYLGAGVKIESISPDWSELKVSMKLRWYNRNAVGTHSGGSLYSMVDPHLMLLLMQRLGRDYVVWDKSASIDFKSPGKGKVTSTITITEDDVSRIKEKATEESACYPEFDVEIRAEDGELVSKIHKILYVKKKTR